MLKLESLTEEDKHKRLLKQLAREDADRRRSAKRAADNQKAGWIRVTVLVPKEDADRTREDAKQRRNAWAQRQKHTEAVSGSDEQEQQLPLFEAPQIEWYLAGERMPG